MFRQQLQELRLKQEQKERDLKGGRRRDLQGETAGERVKPRRGPAQPPNSNPDCDLQSVRLHHYTCSVHMKPQEGVKQLQSYDECFIFWLTPLSKWTLAQFKLARIIFLQIILIGRLSFQIQISFIVKTGKTNSVINVIQ